jgi:threonine dehydrogenase-like Zn-dependent dehydrogenase
MRATVMHGAGDVRVEQVPDAALREPTDAVLRITRASICGSDLWPFKTMGPQDGPRRMGHEFIGVVEDVGPAVEGLAVGDVAVAPFMWSDGSCEFCQEGLYSQCLQGSFWGGTPDSDGGQGEAVRVPQAGGTLVKLPVAADDALMPSLLTLSDVFGTGHYAALCARVGPGATAVVIGDGAVGLCAVLASRRLGAERIVILGHHPERLALARKFGATDVISERGEAAAERVRELTGGHGAECVLECVGLADSFSTALAAVRPGGAIGWVGAPQFEATPETRRRFRANITIAGGPAPTRAFIEELLPDVLEGRIEPGLVFDQTVDLDGVPEGYRAMEERRALKVLIEP